MLFHRSTLAHALSSVWDAFLPQCLPSKLLLLLEDPAQVNTEHHCLSLRLSYAPLGAPGFPLPQHSAPHAGNICSPVHLPQWTQFWEDPLWLLPASQGPAQGLTYSGLLKGAISLI